jgi:V/A-type H+/Na+-transporting ATPase subunit C
MQEIEAGRKLKLGEYPYTYVRTVVMRSLLFKKEDYQKMLKMSFPEIAKFMQESTYRKDIDALATSHSGADLLELAINRNFAHTFRKLLRISTEELGLLIKEYAKRKDVDDVKTILRGKFTGTDEKSIVNSLTMAGVLGSEFLLDLASKENAEQVLKGSGVLDANELKDALKEFDSVKNLVPIENALDRKYYSSTLKFAEMLPEEGSLLRNFLIKEVEILNLLTIVRFRKAQLTKKEIKDLIIKTGIPNVDSRFESISGLEQMEDIAKAMEKTEYGKILANGILEYKNTKSLIKLETDLYRHLLVKSARMLHMNMLSVDTILAFMFSKEIEARNLRILIKGKQLGLSENFIESQLVF